MAVIKPLSIVLIAVSILMAPGLLYASAPGSGPGQVAIAGLDGNIHLYDVVTDTLSDLTTDAVRGQKVYSWPTWSTDGRLAFFGVDLRPDDPFRLGIYIQDPGTAPELVYASANEVFTYAYWAPADCPAGNCRDLAVLYTRTDGNLAARLVRAADEVSFIDLKRGGPFYWDWSPDGQSLFWEHGRQELAIYDVASDSIVQTFAEQPGLHRGVDWSPVDNRLLTAVTGNNITTDLVVLDGEERTVLVDGIRGVVAFEWSPDGTMIAYTDDDAGNLFVVDAQTGARLATPSDNVVGFFWSPDARRIAYVALVRGAGGDTLAKPSFQGPDFSIEWYVYDLASDLSTRLASFLPTRDMIYLLSFYDQFARSHRLWSADSRYLTYAETLDDGSSVVSLLDTTQPGSPPQTIAEGSIAVFSW